MLVSRGNPSGIKRRRPRRQTVLRERTTQTYSKAHTECAKRAGADAGLSLPGQPEGALAVKWQRAVADLRTLSRPIFASRPTRQHVRSSRPVGSYTQDGRHRHPHQNCSRRRSAEALQRLIVHGTYGKIIASWGLVPVDSAAVTRAGRRAATRPRCSEAMTGTDRLRTGRDGTAGAGLPAPAAAGPRDQGDPVRHGGRWSPPLSSSTWSALVYSFIKNEIWMATVWASCSRRPLHGLNAHHRVTSSRCDRRVAGSMWP